MSRMLLVLTFLNVLKVLTTAMEHTATYALAKHPQHCQLGNRLYVIKFAHNEDWKPQ